MTDKEIYKELKRRYRYVEQRGYEVLFIALQGSQNYELAIYSDKYQSDLDCFCVILPPSNSIFDSEEPVSSVITYNDKNEHIGVVDIRLFCRYIEKQNPQYLELLFTKFIIINKKYKNLVQEMVSQRENFVRINPKRLLYSLYGICLNKEKAFKNENYKDTSEAVKKYGYDGKQLYTIIRIVFLIDNYFNKLMSFSDSLKTFDVSQKQICLSAKMCDFSLPMAEDILETYIKTLNQYRTHLETIYTDFIENVVYEQDLIDIKRKILEEYIKSTLYSSEPEKPFDVDKEIEKYNNIWFTSDTHFGHENVLEFEDRYNRLGVKDINEHDQELISRWNKAVMKNDLVFILGDFSFHKAEKTMDILKQLNGDKVLIKGNHDCIYLEDKKFDKSLYKAIYDYKEIKYKNKHFVLMHYPILRFKHQDKEENEWVHLFGHIHSRPIQIPIKSYNVGVDVNEYKPINIDVAYSKSLANNKVTINKKVEETYE